MGRHRAADVSVEFRRRRWRKLITAGLEGACGDRAARVLSAALIFRGSPNFPGEREELDSFLRTELMAAATAVIGHDQATSLIGELLSTIENGTGVARISLTQKRVRNNTPGAEELGAQLGSFDAATGDHEALLSGTHSSAPAQPVMRVSSPRGSLLPSGGSRPPVRNSLPRRKAQSLPPRSDRATGRPVLILSASSFAARAVTLEHGGRIDVRHHYDPVMFEADYQALRDQNPILLLDGRGRHRSFCKEFVARCDPSLRCVLWGFGADLELSDAMIPSVASLQPEDLSMLVGRFLRAPA